MKKTTIGLVSTIITGIQMALTVLITLGVLAITKSSEFSSVFEKELASNNVLLSDLGMDMQSFILLLVTIFIIGASLSIIKFVFALLGYQKNNEVFFIVSAVCSIIFVITFAISFVFILVILELIITTLLFMSYNTTRKNKMNALVNATSISRNDNRDDDEITVIDVEL